MNDMENTVEESLEVYKLSYVITLDRKKWKITLNNIFIGPRNQMLSGNT